MNEQEIDVHACRRRQLVVCRDVGNVGLCNRRVNVTDLGVVCLCGINGHVCCECVDCRLLYVAAARLTACCAVVELYRGVEACLWYLYDARKAGEHSL